MIIDALPPTEIIIVEPSLSLEKMQNNFEFTYTELHRIFANLETYLKTPETLDETTVNKLRKIVADLARFGSLLESQEEIDFLKHDIEELFVEEEPYCQDYYLSVYKNSNKKFSLDDSYIYQISFHKKLKKTAKKVGKFIREHKTEIIIGAAAVVGLGAATYAVASSNNEAASCPPPPQIVHPPSSKAEAKPQDSPNTSAVNEPPILDETFSVTEMHVETFSTQESIANPKDPTFFEKTLKKTREVGALIAHEAWDAVGETGFIIEGLGKELVGVGHKIAPQLFDDPAKHVVWGERVNAGHEMIDKVFVTPGMSEIYQGEKRSVIDSFAIGEIPPPSGILKELKDASKVAKGVRIGEATVITVESFGKRSVSNLIRIQPNGIWNIDGRNIKKLDMNKMLEKNRIRHIFENPGHNLDKLKLTPEATYEKLTRALVEKDLAGEISLNNPFRISVKIDEYEIIVKGIVENGELKYSTFYIPNN